MLRRLALLLMATASAVALAPPPASAQMTDTQAVFVDYVSRSVRVIDSTTGTSGTPLYLSEYPIDVVSTPDGTKAIATSYSPGGLIFIDLTTDPPTYEGFLSIPAPVYGPFDIDVACANSDYAIVTGYYWSAGVASVDLNTRTVVQSIQVPGMYTAGCNAVSPDGTKVLVGGGDYWWWGSTLEMAILNLSPTGQLTDSGIRTTLPHSILNLYFLPDGVHALAVGPPNSVTLLDLSSGIVPTSTVSTSSYYPQSAAISAASDRAYVINAYDSSVEVIEISSTGLSSAGTISGISGGMVNNYAGPEFVALSPDEQRLFVRTYYGVTVIDTTTLTQVVAYSMPGTWAGLGGIATQCNMGAAADRLEWVDHPSATEVQFDTWGEFSVRVVGPDGETYTDATEPVTVQTFSGTGILSGTLVQTPVDGIATFSDLEYDTAETMSIVVTSPNLLAVGAQVIVTPANSDVRIQSGDVTLTPSGATIEVGEPTWIEAVVHNVGSAAADVSVGFWLGDPGVLEANAQDLGTQSGTIALGGTGTFGTWWTPLEEGLQSVFVVVDNTTPGGTDSNPADNRTTRTVSVGAAEEELGIAAGEWIAWPGAQASVPITVTNIGWGPATITASSYGPPGWLTPITPLVGTTLQPGESLLALAQLDVPTTATGAPLGGAPEVQVLPIELSTASGAYTGQLVVKLFEEAASTVTVRVVDDATGSPIANALVASQTVPATYTTGYPNGEVVLNLPPGPNGIFAYRTGYVARAEAFDIPQGASSVELRLTAGQTLSVDQVVSEPLTTDEILERGVDVSDPVNNTIYDFTVAMKIGDPIVIPNVELPKEEPTSGQTSFTRVVAPAGGGGGGGGLAGGGGTLVTAIFDYNAYGRTETWIIIPGQVWTLKQFFEVTTFVFNNASAPEPEDVQLVDVEANLNLPGGLAFPDLDGSPQPATISLGTLDAQEGAEAVWVIRGDVPGSYELNGLVTADLWAFGAFQAELSALATSDPFTVDVPRLRCEFLTPEVVTANEPFTFGVLVTNEANSIANLVRVILEEDDLTNCTLEGTEALQDPAVSFAYDDLGAVVSATYTIGDLEPGTSGLGSFQLISFASGTVIELDIENGCGTAPSPPVEVLAQPPTIVAQPTPVTACAGDAVATFQVTAEGFAPITYQWRKDGEPIAGATEATLYVEDVAVEDAGSYDVVVSNPGGDTVSDPVLLTVNVAPSFELFPVDVVTCQGSGDVIFASEAIAEPAATYQWYWNGEPLPGETFSTLTLSGATPANDGTYEIVATNACGMTAASASLTVQVAPVITTTLEAREVTEGGSTIFSVEATGVPAPTFEWRRDGVLVDGATGSSLTLEGITYDDRGVYEVTAVNACGSSSRGALLTVNRRPVFTCNGPFELWSPHHDLVDVSSVFAVTDPDGDALALTVRVFSDETEVPETGDGTGKHAPDFKNEMYEGGRGLLLRSERRGKEDGRWYAIVVTADDGRGGVTTSICGAATPHDQNDESFAEAAAQLEVAVAQIQGAIDAADGSVTGLPLTGHHEHGLASEMGPKQ